MSNYLRVNNVNLSDYVQSLRIGFETLVSEDSGRNAAGNTVIDIVNRKDKVYITFRPMNQTEMASVLSAKAPFVVSTTYLNPKTGTNKTINCYTNTPEPEFYRIIDGKILYKPLSLNLIEM